MPWIMSGSPTWADGLGTDAYEEAVFGYDAVGRVCFQHCFSLSSVLQEIGKKGGTYAGGDVEHQRAKMLSVAVNDYAISRVVEPSPWIARWELVTSDGERLDVTEAVRAAGHRRFDFRHQPEPEFEPLPTKRKWWRR
jgi:hypothetical protein